MPYINERVVYQLPGMSAALVKRDLIYRTEGETSLHMDVYTPSNLPPTTRLPAVFFIHGGPNGDETALKNNGIYRSYGELSTACGFIGITFDHRYATSQQLRFSESDVSAAIAFVRTHAEEMQVDPDRLGLWIFSGGGPLLSGFLRERRPISDASLPAMLCSICEGMLQLTLPRR